MATKGELLMKINNIESANYQIEVGLPTNQELGTLPVRYLGVPLLST